MLLKTVIYFTCAFSFISGASIKIKRDTSDADYEAWLRELESQIIVNSEELQNAEEPEIPVPVVPPGKVDTAEEVKEPLVVTSKPYLTGDENQKEEGPVTENINENESKSGRIPDSVTTTENGSSNATRRIYKEKDDSRRSRELLDKILSNQTLTIHHKHSSQDQRFSDDDGSNGSEVTSFVTLVKNRVPMIILGVILSLLVLVALTVTIYQVLKNWNANSAITLVSHYEYDDVLDKNSQVLKVSG